MCCWRSPGCWTQVWTWSLCPYVWDCVSRASTQKRCLQSSKNCVKPLNPSRPLKTARTDHLSLGFLGSGPIPGSKPSMGSPANQMCLCVGTLSSACPWWLTVPGLCFDLCLSFWVEVSASVFFLNSSALPTWGHAQPFCLKSLTFFFEGQSGFIIDVLP